MLVIGYATTSAAGQILQHLQRQGEATVKDLAALLGVSATAARDHLVHLQAEGLVEARAERYGPGRPRLVYTLSEAARSRFPKQYDRLITGLLRELIAVEGPDKVEQLLERVSRRLADEYADRMEGSDMPERLGELRRLLEQRGVPAEVAEAGDGIRLFACPFYDIAQDHPEVCSMERQMIEFVLGEKLALESTIREGAHTCRFVLRSGEIPLTPARRDQ
ncbi:MAG TPA: MarR family transcriptional regulator [Chloroflexaceae bacterium]|nr:MarR family transcriptional regulator [Chloroflexaceae bacterium]